MSELYPELEDRLLEKKLIEENKNYYYVKETKEKSNLLFSIICFFATLLGLGYASYILLYAHYDISYCSILHMEQPTYLPNETHRRNWNKCTLPVFNTSPQINFTYWSPCITLYTDFNNKCVPVLTEYGSYIGIGKKNSTTMYGSGNKPCTLGCMSTYDSVIYLEDQHRNGMDYYKDFLERSIREISYPTMVRCYNKSVEVFTYTYIRWKDYMGY